MSHNEIIIESLKKEKEEYLRERKKLVVLLKKDNMNLRQKASIESQIDFIDGVLHLLDSRIQVYR